MKKREGIRKRRRVWDEEGRKEFIERLGKGTGIGEK